MAAPRKYPDELRERAIRLVLDGKADPANSGRNVLRRVGEQLGINPETLRGWASRPRSTPAIGRARRPIRPPGWPSWSGKPRVAAGQHDPEVSVVFLRGGS